MNDSEFDHDAEANEYHIAVKQHLYERIRELEAKVERLRLEPRLALLRRERDEAQAQGERLREALRELEADARLKLTSGDLALGLSAVAFASIAADKGGATTFNALPAIVRRYDAAHTAAVAAEGDEA
jgi:TolA-binding protein